MRSTTSFTITTQPAVHVTASHLLQIMPTAPIGPAASLLGSTGEGPSVIDDILMRCGITDPRAVAMFLAIAAYDSDGLTKFRAADGETLEPGEWLYRRAMKWFDLKLNILAEKNAEAAFSAAVERASWGTARLGVRRQIWRRACAAFGVKIIGPDFTKRSAGKMTNADEILIAELVEIWPGLPLHAAREMVELLNGRMDALRLELGGPEDSGIDEADNPHLTGEKL